MDTYPDYETVEYHLIYAELIHAARHRGTESLVLPSLAAVSETEKVISYKN